MVACRRRSAPRTSRARADPASSCGCRRSPPSCRRPASTRARVAVAMPESRPSRLSAVRSPARSARAGPRDAREHRAGADARRRPRPRASNSTPASSSAKTAAAIGSPATTPRGAADEARRSRAPPRRITACGGEVAGAAEVLFERASSSGSQTSAGGGSGRLKRSPGARAAPPRPSTPWPPRPPRPPIARRRRIRNRSRSRRRRRARSGTAAAARSRPSPGNRAGSARRGSPRGATPRRATSAPRPTRFRSSDAPARQLRARARRAARRAAASPAPSRIRPSRSQASARSSARTDSRRRRAARRRRSESPPSGAAGGELPPRRRRARSRPRGRRRPAPRAASWTPAGSRRGRRSRRPRRRPRARAGSSGPRSSTVDAAHEVVRGRHDRDRLDARVDAGLRQAAKTRGKRTRKALADRRARVEEDRVARAPAAARWRAPRRRAARARRPGARRRGSAAALVDQRRALAAQRLGEERQRIALDGERGGMELHELEVDQPRAGRGGQQQPVAGRLAAGWWCSGRAGRCRRWRAPTRGAAVAAPGGRRRGAPTTPASRPAARRPARSAKARSNSSIHGARADARAERAHQLGAGRVAVGVQDPAPAVRRLAAERELAALAAVELGAELAPAGRTAGTPSRATISATSASTRPGARGDGVGGVELGRVAGADRGRHAALRPGARARCERGLGQQVDAQPGGAAPSAAARPGHARRRRRRRRRPAARVRRARLSTRLSSPRPTSSIRSTARRARRATSRVDLDLVLHPLEAAQDLGQA